EAARVRRMAGAGQHGGLPAVDADRGAAHAARVAEGEQHLRRIAAQARAGMLGARHERAAVGPGRRERSLHDVAVDLEDAAVARLEGDLRVDVERRRRGGELPGAPLGHELAILALALDRLPGLGAVALE